MNAVTIHQQSFAVSDLERMALALAGSKLFGINTPDQALALCLVAQAEGRHPASAAQDYHIIQGRPSKKADAMLRDFLANGGKVEWHALSDDLADATFSHPAGGTVRIAWDIQRVKKAGIKNADMYGKFPRQMLRSRTVSEGVRTVFPLATSGMYVPEEVQEFDAPKQASNHEVANVTTGEFVDAELVPPAEPKRQLVRQTREAFVEMRDEIDKCADVDALKKLWRSPAFKAEYEKLSEQYQEGIVEHFNKQTAALTESPLVVPEAYNFDNLEREGADAAQ